MNIEWKTIVNNNRKQQQNPLKNDYNKQQRRQGKKRNLFESRIQKTNMIDQYCNWFFFNSMLVKSERAEQIVVEIKSYI